MVQILKIISDYIKVGKEITSSQLGFDKYLSKLNREEFEKELNNYLLKSYKVKIIINKNLKESGNYIEGKQKIISYS